MSKAADPDFKTKKIVKNYCQTINAEPAKVFPLLCPVKEAQWLDGWQYHLFYSESGFAEEGCVFSTPQKGEQDTIWVITKHDKVNYEIQFVRFTPDSRTCVLNISVEPLKKNTSSVHIEYAYTAISDAGNQFIAELTEERFLSAVKFWEKSMNYFLATGKKLRK